MVGSIGKSNAGITGILLNLNKNEKEKTKTLAELASGQKAFSSDPAGGAISAKLDAIDKQLSQGSRNAGDFVSVVELRDSALSQVSSLQDRQAELAAQAANGTYSAEQREVLDREFQSNQAEIERIQATTEFNGINLFEGTSLTAQVGTDSSESSQITLESIQLTSSPKNILSADAARSALDELKTDQTSISNARASDGAAVARLETAASNNEETRQALAAANSRIRDVDVADATARLTRQNIQSDVGSALGAQNIKNQQIVLQLLR